MTTRGAHRASDNRAREGLKHQSIFDKARETLTTWTASQMSPKVNETAQTEEHETGNTRANDMLA